MITLIVAMTRSRVIGRGGKMPWRLPDEAAHFRRTTMGGALVMGRKTFESIGRPLKGRRVFVVSRTMPPHARVTVCRSLGEALDAARASGLEVFVAGGGEIYRVALPLADRLLVSYVAGDHPGETTFPEIDPDAWRVRCEEDHGTFTVVDYRRRTPAPSDAS